MCSKVAFGDVLRHFRAFSGWWFGAFQGGILEHCGFGGAFLGVLGWHFGVFQGILELWDL